MGVTLWIPCLMDQFQPEAGMAVVEVLQTLGFKVGIPKQPICCGQPAFNDGYDEEARIFARRFLRFFRDTPCIVCPSGSCTAMVKLHYPQIFSQSSEEHQQALALSERIYEFSAFLAEQASAPRWKSLPLKIAYHPSCHLMRELGVQEAPMKILQQIPQLQILKFSEMEECCGFGGIFSLRMPSISCRIADRKLASIQNSGAQAVVSCDSGCLLHLQTRAQKSGSSLRFLHLSQVLKESLL